MVTKANRVLGLIHKTFNCNMITKLFKSLIIPILEYGNLIWGPHYVADQQEIEGVQWCATKLISSICHCPYPERLKNFKLTIFKLLAVERRHDIFVSNHSPQFRFIFNDLFQPALTTSTRGHNIKFFKPRCKTCYRCNFFSNRTIDNWNNLPTHIVNADSINSFKNVLDNCYFDSLFIV